MAELFYFPFYVNDWLGGEATSQMTPAQEGAFIRLLAISWASKTAPCTLPNDDAALAQMSRLHGQWKKLGPFIKQQFELVDGRLRNPKLWDVYQASLALHHKKVLAGSLGGKSKAKGKPKQSFSSATAEGVANTYQSKSELKIETDLTTPPPPALVGFAESPVPMEYRTDLCTLLDRVAATPDASVEAWMAEIRVAGDGMHGPAVTGEQLGRAVRDFNGNGGDLSLKLFRGYLRDAARPPAPPKTHSAKGIPPGQYTYTPTTETPKW